MKAIAVVALPLLMLSQSASPFGAFKSGQDLYDASLADKRVDANTASGANHGDAQRYLGYVTGVADTLSAMNILCMPDHTTVGQLVAIVSKYVDDHPAQWSLPGAGLVDLALVAMYPCQKKGK